MEQPSCGRWHGGQIPFGSFATVAKTSQESPTFANTSLWSTEPAVPPKYRKTDVKGEEKIKRDVLASSRKRAGILYPLNLKSLGLFFCFFFFFCLVSTFFLKFVCMVCRSNLILCFYKQPHSSFLYNEKNSFQIPVRKKMLSVSPANYIFIIHPFVFVKRSQMETDQLTLEASWINTSCGGAKGDLKGRQ